MVVRKDTRLLVRCPVTYVLEDRTCQGTMLNMSRGGGAIESEEMAQIGDSVSLQIIAPGQPTAIQVELGKVCWATSREFGVEFLVISGDSKERLNHFLIEMARQSAM